MATKGACHPCHIGVNIEHAFVVMTEDPYVGGSQRFGNPGSLDPASQFMLYKFFTAESGNNMVRDIIPIEYICNFRHAAGLTVCEPFCRH